MSLLEEAIIEAGKLREAATIQAKNDIISKYSDEIRDRMDSMLHESILDEAPEDELDLMDDLEPDLGMGDDSMDFEDDLDIMDSMGTEGSPEDMESMDNQIPMGFVNGEDEIEIDFDDLVDMMDDSVSGDMLDREDAAEDIVGSEEDDDDFGSFVNDDLSGMLQEIEDELNADDDDDNKILVDEEEEVYEEANKVDMKAVGKGFSPRPRSELDKEASRTEISQEYDSVFDAEDEEGIASSVTNSKKTKIDDKKDKFNKKSNPEANKINIKDKINENKVLKADKNRLLEECNILKSKNRMLYTKLTEASEVLDMMILEQEKMKLQVKILKSDRLNGRQKNKIVEAILSARTLNEAQTIFELQNVTASEKSVEKNPAREAINNLPRNQTRLKGVLREQVEEKDPTVDRMTNRWQEIAGIKK
jgi:hypothetical protein